jgi:alkylation response protein AidB-like acyl-CoA dehydrogenase
MKDWNVGQRKGAPSGRDFESIAAELATAAGARAAEHDRTGSVPAESIEQAGTLHAPALTVPSELGGWGANLLEFARYQERLARGDGATALILAMHHMLIGGEAEAGLWPAAEWEEVCHAALESGALINAASSEPGAGSPSLGGVPQTLAEPADPRLNADQLPGSSWYLTGRKAYTTGAPLLTYVRVSARVEPQVGEPYGARFLVRMPAHGAAIEDDRWNPMGLRAAANDTVLFERTPATFLYQEDRRGCEGNIWFQVAVAATYLGIGQAAYETGVRYARERKPASLEKPVSELESVRLRIGRMRAELMLARRHLFACCQDWLETAQSDKETLVTSFSLAKVASVNAAANVADAALRLAGAGGLSRELPLERYVRETRAGLAHPPVDDVAYLALAKEDLERE